MLEVAESFEAEREGIEDLLTIGRNRFDDDFNF